MFCHAWLYVNREAIQNEAKQVGLAPVIDLIYTSAFLQRRKNFSLRSNLSNVQVTSADPTLNAAGSEGKDERRIHW